MESKTWLEFDSKGRLIGIGGICKAKELKCSALKESA